MRLAMVVVCWPGARVVGLDVIEIANEGNVQDIPGEARGRTQYQGSRTHVTACGAATL